MMSVDYRSFLAKTEASSEDGEYPFWGYFDLFVIIGICLPALLLRSLSLGIFLAAPRMRVAFNAGAAVALADQSILYLVFCGIVALWFRVQHDRPFWRSMGWVEMRLSFLRIVLFGLATGCAVTIIGTLIRTPTAPNDMTKLIADRPSLLLVAVFGISVGPLFEELAFRGLLQSLLVKSLGPLPGILLSAIPFGLLHYREYGNSWRHALLVAAAGAAFGWMRYRTGSTKASTLMHASYNAVVFVGAALQSAH